MRWKELTDCPISSEQYLQKIRNFARQYTKLTDADDNAPSDGEGASAAA